MLELRALSKHFGGVRAVDELDITVEHGEIFGLIGPNGSGKSTTVNLVCGVFPVTAGTISFEGTEITNNPPHVALGNGIARTFQNIRLFSELTVWQNLWVAQNGRESVQAQGFFSRWLSGDRRQRASVEEQLEFSGLGDKRDELAGSPRVRGAAAPRACPRPRGPPQAPAPRRAGRGNEPRRGEAAR